MREILVALVVAVGLAGCVDDGPAKPPGPDAAFGAPSGPPIACAPGWHPDGHGGCAPG
jgi:hypothetical protein